MSSSEDEVTVVGMLVDGIYTSQNGHVTPRRRLSRTIRRRRLSYLGYLSPPPSPPVEVDESMFPLPQPPAHAAVVLPPAPELNASFLEHGIQPLPPSPSLPPALQRPRLANYRQPRRIVSFLMDSVIFLYRTLQAQVTYLKNLVLRNKVATANNEKRSNNIAAEVRSNRSSNNSQSSRLSDVEARVAVLEATVHHENE